MAARLVLVDQRNYVRVSDSKKRGRQERESVREFVCKDKRAQTHKGARAAGSYVTIAERTEWGRSLMLTRRKTVAVRKYRQSSLKKFK